ncbi:hypothetical protein PQX77_010969, partial [Marasmius sp. AFHP31]
FPNGYAIINHMKNPSARSPSGAWKFGINTGPSSFYGEKFKVEKAFEDNGEVASGSTSAVHDAQRGLVFLHGIAAPWLTPSPPPIMSASNTARTKNVTYDDRDFQYLRYDKWYTEGTWSSPSESGTLSSANDLHARLTFTFPQQAIAFYYYGMKRSGGGLYGLCIDCDPDVPVDDKRFETIDALDTSDNGQNPPVVLFSRTFNTPGAHVVVLTNRNDTRIVPSGSSQITVDRFVLVVPDDSQPALPQQPSVTTSSSSTANSESRSTTATDDISRSSSTQSSSTSSSSVSGASPLSFTSSHMSSSSLSSTVVLAPSSATTGDVASSTPPVAAIAGAAVGGVLMIIILIIVGLCCWRRKRAREAIVNGRSFRGPSHSSSSQINPSHDPSTTDLSSSLIGSTLLTTTYPDASGTLSSGATTRSWRTRFKFKFWRARSHDAIDDRTSPPPRSFLARFNLPGNVNQHPPVANPTLSPFIQMYPDISKEELSKTASNDPPTFTSTLMSSSGSRLTRERRREVDAGPVTDEDTTEDDGMSTLPPLYEHVFRSRFGVGERSVPILRDAVTPRLPISSRPTYST